jgi:MoaA/NifB/PqqE/SkfB family radical SAM enzyme
MRISIDGLGATYEEARGRPFAVLMEKLQAAKALCPLGINVVVNARTLVDLDALLDLASSHGVSEVLLLPERRTAARSGIDAESRSLLQKWVATYRGGVRLAISQGDADGFPVCDPFASEGGLRSYAHIDANGTVKASSYDASGCALDTSGVLSALDKLERAQGVANENLAKLRV